MAPGRLAQQHGGSRAVSGLMNTVVGKLARQGLCSLQCDSRHILPIQHGKLGL